MCRGDPLGLGGGLGEAAGGEEVDPRADRGAPGGRLRPGALGDRRHGRLPDDRSLVDAPDPAVEVPRADPRRPIPEGRSGAPGGPSDRHVPDTRGWRAPARRTRRGFPRPVRAGSRAGPRARHASVPRPAERRRGRAVPDGTRPPPPRATAIAGRRSPRLCDIFSPHDRETQRERGSRLRPQGERQGHGRGGRGLPAADRDGDRRARQADRSGSWPTSPT